MNSHGYNIALDSRGISHCCAVTARHGLTDIIMSLQGVRSLAGWRGLATLSQRPSWTSLRLNVSGRRAELTLARPEVRNALSTSLLRELREACTWLNCHEPEVQAVVLRGEGAGFCGGMDTSEESSIDGFALGELGFASAAAIADLNAVAIGALHGHVVGGGMVLASACDLRVASDDVRFMLPEVALGVPLTWGGTHRLLADLGAAKVKELILTGRPMGASEAAACGFVNTVAGSHAEMIAAASSLADTVASRPRHAVTAAKRGANAIVSQMVGLQSAGYSDAAVLAAGLLDAEGRAARRSQLAALNGPRASRRNHTTSATPHKYARRHGHAEGFGSTPHHATHCTIGSRGLCSSAATAPQPHTLFEAIAARAQATPALEALVEAVSDGRRLDYAGLVAEATDVSAALSRVGVVPSDRLAMIGTSRVALASVFLGANR